MALIQVGEILKCSTTINHSRSSLTSSSKSSHQSSSSSSSKSSPQSSSSPPAQSALQVQEALRRRGLALDFADVCTFSVHETYLQMLFTHLHRDPPAGFSRCTVSQLVSADREADTSWQSGPVVNRSVKSSHLWHYRSGCGVTKPGTALCAAETMHPYMCWIHQNPSFC